MEAVQLVCGHHVQVSLGLFYAPEMAAGVQMHSAVFKARAVKDAGVGEYPIGLGLFASVNGGRQHLLQRFASVHKAVQGSRLYFDAFFVDINGVFLRAKVGVYLEFKTAVGISHLYAGSCFQRIYEAAYGIK